MPDKQPDDNKAHRHESGVPSAESLVDQLRKLGLDWRPPQEAPPSDNVFTAGMYGPPAHDNTIATNEELARLKVLKEGIQKLQRGQAPRDRVEQFLPFLLIRTVVGDNGDRPLDVNTIPPTLSPDIWIQPGHPSSHAAEPTSSPPIRDAPFGPSVGHGRYSWTPHAHGFGGELTAGEPHTLHAHVWNLGRAPLLGIWVEFLHATTSFYEDTPSATTRLGMARVDLAPRNSRLCHRFVRCPEPFVPHAESHTLIVRVSGLGDAVTDPWSPWNDRHVAFRQL